MKNTSVTLLAVLVCAGAARGAPAAASSGEAAFRGVYKELVKTDTARAAAHWPPTPWRCTCGRPASPIATCTCSRSRSPRKVAWWRCTLAATRRRRLAGAPDVVEAKREDWTRDRFTLMRRSTFLRPRFGRQQGRSRDTLVRSRGFRPRRTVELASPAARKAHSAVNGAVADREPQGLDRRRFRHQRRGTRQARRRRPSRGSQGPGRREDRRRTSSWRSPTPAATVRCRYRSDAIYHLAAALLKIGGYTFPAQFTDGNRSTGGQVLQAAQGKADVAKAMAMTALVVPHRRSRWCPRRTGAGTRPCATTCVATMLNSGHAPNALPQRARANVNCRFPAWPSRACAPSWKSWWRTPRSR